MASKELLDLLNNARELQASIQYMWQQWSGVKGYAVHDEFKSTGIVEMKYAEKIAERLFYLGGKTTTEPAPITVGKNLEDMLKEDIKAEKEGDVTTAHLFSGVLEQEEEHHDVFTTLIEDA